MAARQTSDSSSLSHEGKVICILGMHRSGTSLVARLLNLCGVDLGPPEHLMPATKDNPSGYWEHLAFHQINDQILEQFGSSWHEPPSFPPGWERRVELQPLYDRARKMIQANFSEVGCWGWKDPRTALVLPFWKRLLPELTFVVCVRHPLDVCHSLNRRDEFPLAKGMHLWAHYIVATLLHTGNSPRIITHYENYFTDWKAELSRLRRFLGLWDCLPDSATGHIQSFVEPQLWHHRSSLEDLLQSPQTNSLCAALYTALLDASTAGGSTNPTLEAHLQALGTLANEFETVSQTFADTQSRLLRYQDLPLMNTARWLRRKLLRLPDPHD